VGEKIKKTFLHIPVFEASNVTLGWAAIIAAL
jgi:hypothetical protein